MENILNSACQDQIISLNDKTATKEKITHENEKGIQSTLTYELHTLRSRLTADQRLDLLITTKEITNIIWFRVTGHRALGATDSNHLRLQHGIDYDSMNREFLQLVNNAGNLFIIGRNIDEYGFFVGLSFINKSEDKERISMERDESEMEIDNVNGNTIESNWQTMEKFLILLDGIEAKILDKYEGHLALCKCGH